MLKLGFLRVSADKQLYEKVSPSPKEYKYFHIHFVLCFCSCIFLLSSCIKQRLLGLEDTCLHGNAAAMSSTSTSASAACSGGDAAAVLASERYASLILAQMNKMRLRSDFCDVGLEVGGQVFKVHRLVLAASSPYFSALFSGGMREADKDQVQIIGVDTGIFEILLDFIYTGMYLFSFFFFLSFCFLMHPRFGLVL